jgi:hypothetical protein
MEWLVIGSCVWTLMGVPICNGGAGMMVTEEVAYVCDENGCFDRGIVGGPGRYVYPGYRPNPYQSDDWRYSGGRPRYQGDDYYRFRHGTMPGQPGYRRQYVPRDW